MPWGSSCCDCLGLRTETGDSDEGSAGGCRAGVTAIMVEATGARAAAVGVGAAVMVRAAAVVEAAAVEGATVVEEAVRATFIGARIAVLVGGGAALGVAAAVEAASVNDANLLRMVVAGHLEGLQTATSVRKRLCNAFLQLESWKIHVYTLTRRSRASRWFLL